jgi:putative iron-only hydrogenase system regulator
MKRIAVVSAVLDEPHQCQKEFNEIVSAFQGMIKGRMGIPFEEAPVAVICITVVGELDEINSLTGRLGRIPGVTVKTAVAKTQIP